MAASTSTAHGSILQYNVVVINILSSFLSRKPRTLLWQLIWLYLSPPLSPPLGINSALIGSFWHWQGRNAVIDCRFWPSLIVYHSVHMARLTLILAAALEASISERVDDFECILCLKLLYKQLHTPCGQTLCRDCFLRAGENSTK